MSSGFIPDSFVSQPKSQPSEAVVIWKGGARERADDVLSFRRNKRTSEQSGLCSDVSSGFIPDIFVSQPKSQPSEAVVIWKGEARGRADNALFCPAGIKERRSKADFAPM